MAATAVAAGRVIRLEVVGDSMLPTLRPGDRLLARPRRRIHPGELVAVPDPRRPDRLLVKRVEGIIGEEVYLAGDNPAASTDSRTFGTVARSSVAGQVRWRYWPPDRAGRL